MNDVVLRCVHVVKSYQDEKLAVDVLMDINLTVNRGEQVAIVGKSGSGKSTLLHVLGGLDSLSGGEVYILEKDLWKLSEKERCEIRNRHLGFVYQFHHLLPEFSALENVAMPLLIGGELKSRAADRAKFLLTEVGLSHRLKHKPSQLSGGERQRIAIARALVNSPSCLLVDEPTGNLDQNTASQVYETMLKLNQSLGTALLIVTHDVSLSNKMDRVLNLEQGILI